jgi:hypothetical protein
VDYVDFGHRLSSGGCYTPDFISSASPTAISPPATSLGVDAHIGVAESTPKGSDNVSEIKLVFSIPPHRPAPNFAPGWKAAPTDLLPVVRYDRRAGERSLDLLRWRLIPHWAKDINIGFANIIGRKTDTATHGATIAELGCCP